MQPTQIKKQTKGEKLTIKCPAFFTQECKRTFLTQNRSKLETFLPLHLSNTDLDFVCHRHETSKNPCSLYTKLLRI